MVNDVFLIKRIEIWWRETLEVHKRITLFGTGVAQFDLNDDGLLDNLGEVHVVDQSSIT